MGTYVNQIAGNTSDAGAYLSSGWSELNSRADAAFSSAMSIASSNITLNPIDISLTSAPTIGSSISVSVLGEPVAPTIPPLVINYPATPSLLGASYTLGAAPTFSSLAPSINYPSKPDTTLPTDPGTAPIISTPLMPDDPNFTLPDVPSLRSLSLPEVPDIYLPTFSAQSPANDLPDLVQPNFVLDETPYSAQLSQLSSKIAQYLAFDFDASETAIWDRGQERVDRATNTAVNAISNDFAARGFSLPSGSMLAAINEARMKGAEARYDNARDAMIKAAELNTQKLTVAIQSGIQYEGMWMNYQTAYAQRAFEAEKVMIDVALKLFDAKVSLFNAKLQVYQTEAQVHRELVQSELARIELYKTELEGQKIIGELNMQDVELYKAQLSGAMAVIDVYKAQVGAVIAEIEVDKARLQGYETSVQAYKARIEANSSEYAAWGEQMRGEAIKGQLYETEVRAFAARVDAYKSQEGIGIESEKLKIMNNEMLVKEYQARLGVVDSEVKAFSAEVDAKARMYSAQSQVYSALIGGREAEAKIKLGQESLGIDAYKVAASMSIEQARANIAAQDVAVRAFIGRMQSSGQIVGQLAASAMSAFNLSASVSEGFSLGVSNSLSESHSLSS